MKIIRHQISIFVMLVTGIGCKRQDSNSIVFGRTQIEPLFRFWPIPGVLNKGFSFGLNLRKHRLDQVSAPMGRLFPTSTGTDWASESVANANISQCCLPLRLDSSILANTSVCGGLLRLCRDFRLDLPRLLRGLCPLFCEYLKKDV